MEVNSLAPQQRCSTYGVFNPQCLAFISYHGPYCKEAAFAE